MRLNKEEFHAFLLIYIEKADFFEQVEEHDYILTKVSDETCKRVSKAFDKLSDIDRANLITEHKDVFTPAELDTIFGELNELMDKSDGTEAAEIAVFTGLKRLLR